MQRSATDILLELLIIIKYPNNKQRFIAKFEEVNKKETIANMLERLPEETQKYLENVSDPTEVNQYIPEEAYQQEFIKVSTEAMKKLIQAISPILTLDQKEKIVKLISLN